MIGLLHLPRDELTMKATVIDTLRLADRLKAAGFEAPRAEGLARALGDELADRMLTRRDLDEALLTIDTRFDALEPRFDAIDARFDAIDAKFDVKFDAIDAKFDAMDVKIDVKFDAMDVKIEAVHRELSGKFNILVGMMALGFTLLGALGTYNAVSPRFADTAKPSAMQQPAILPVEATTEPAPEI